MKKFLKLFSLAITLIMTLILLTGCSGYESEVDKAIEAYITGDAKALEEMHSYREQYAKLIDLDQWNLVYEAKAWEEKTDGFKKAVEKCFEADFKDVAIEYELTETKTLSDLDETYREQFEIYSEDVKEKLDIDITDSADVSFSLILEYEGREEKVEGVATLAKLDGDWYLRELYVGYNKLNRKK